MLNCGNCGASVTETAIYCSICGQQLVVGAAGKAASPPVSPLAKAASALAKASGLAKSQRASRFGLIVRVASVLAGVSLALSAYQVYRNQSVAGLPAALNIVSPLDKFTRLMSAGNTSYEQGDFKTAIAKFEEADSLFPKNTEVLKKLADVYIQDQQIDNALVRYSQVVEIDPKNVEARYQRAEIQLTRGFWKEAVDDLQYLAVNAPHTEQGERARQFLGGSFLVKRAIEPLIGKLPTTRKGGKNTTPLPEIDNTPPQLALTLPKLVNGVPVTPPAPSASNPEEHAGASVLAKRRKDKGQYYLNARLYYSAIRELQNAHQLAPDDSDLYYLLGQAHDGLKQYGQARKYYEQCDRGDYVQVARSAAQRAKKNEEKLAKKTQKEEKSED